MSKTKREDNSNTTNTTGELQTLKQELIQKNHELIEKDKIIDELSVPIIPSIIPDTILVPLIGSLDTRRIRVIQERVLDSVYKEKVDTVIIDFTSITVGELSELGGVEGLGYAISQLQMSLNLVGAEVILVGLSSRMAITITQAGIDVKNFSAYSTFRTALQYLMKKRGLTFYQLEK